MGATLAGLVVSVVDRGPTGRWMMDDADGGAL